MKVVDSRETRELHLPRRPSADEGDDVVDISDELDAEELPTGAAGPVGAPLTPTPTLRAMRATPRRRGVRSSGGPGRFRA
nr:hypothetical protein [Parafrankia sp. CH37]